MNKLEVNIKEIIKELRVAKEKILKERNATGDPNLHAVAMSVFNLIIIELQSAIINSKEEDNND